MACDISGSSIFSHDELIHPSDTSKLDQMRTLCPDAFRTIFLPADGYIMKQEWKFTFDRGDELCQTSESWQLVEPITNQAQIKNSLAVLVAAGVKQELEWYFRERTSYRILGWRCDAVSSTPRLHCFLARHMLRFVDSPALVDSKTLRAWYTFLDHVVDAKVFTQSKWLGHSKFERCLTACMVLFEKLYQDLEGKDPTQLQSTCSFTLSELDFAVQARASRIGELKVSNTFEKMHHRLNVLNPRRILAGKWCPSSTLSCHETVMMVSEQLAYAEFGIQFIAELWAYQQGLIDEWVFIEDMAMEVCKHVTILYGPQCMLTLFGIHAASQTCSLLLGTMLREGGFQTEEKIGTVVGKTMELCCETRERRALRCAYACLGLSPHGVFTYSATRIESQLDFALRRGGDALWLWAAYEFIRSRQHPELRNPFTKAPDPGNRSEENSIGSLDDCNRQGMSRAEALQILSFDPEHVHQPDRIRKRYLELCLVHHPDKLSGNHCVYLRVRRAYDTLMAED